MSCLVVNSFQGLPRKEKKRKAEEAAEEPAAKEVKVVPPQDTQSGWIGRPKFGRNMENPTEDGTKPSIDELSSKLKI